MVGDGAIVGLDHVQVAAPPGCENAARAFYGGLLGLEELVKPPPLSRRGGAWFRLGTHELHVGVADAFTPAAKAHPGVRVSSREALEELAERLVAAGHEVDWADPGETPGRVRFYVHGSFGNRLELLATLSS